MASNTPKDLKPFMDNADKRAQQATRAARQRRIDDYIEEAVEIGDAFICLAFTFGLLYLFMIIGTRGV
jgi:hypothetical protein